MMACGLSFLASRLSFFISLRVFFIFCFFRLLENMCLSFLTYTVLHWSTHTLTWCKREKLHWSAGRGICVLFPCRLNNVVCMCVMSSLSQLTYLNSILSCCSAVHSPLHQYHSLWSVRETRDPGQGQVKKLSETFFLLLLNRYAYCQLSTFDTNQRKW